MIWLVLAIVAWGAVHSWLASLGVKAWFRRAFGEPAARTYRLAYNVFSVASLAPILYLLRILPDRLLYSAQGPWLIVMLAGQVLALVCLFIALLQTDTLSFVGLRQLFSGDPPARFVKTGFYRWVRHPLYLFGLLLLWLTPRMTLNMLVAYFALTVYIFVGVLFEERKLLREFGSAYAEYRSRTPMILPFPFRRVPQSPPPHT